MKSKGFDIEAVCRRGCARALTGGPVNTANRDPSGWYKGYNLLQPWCTDGTSGETCVS
jgi:hypothetical protein